MAALGRWCQTPAVPVSRGDTRGCTSDPAWGRGRASAPLTTPTGMRASSRRGLSVRGVCPGWPSAAGFVRGLALGRSGYPALRALVGDPYRFCEAQGWSSPRSSSSRVHQGFVDRPASCPAFSCSGRVLASAIRDSRRRNTSSRLRLRSKSVGSPVARCRASVNSTSVLK